MPKLVMGLILVVLVIVLAGVAFLATAEIPAPSQPTERTLPDDRFPK